MDRTIHLLRHGEVANPDEVVYASLPGFGLSEVGRRQAAQAGDRLRSGRVALVVSSPLERAVETGTAVAAATGADLVTDERLTEWGLADRWSGVAWDDLAHRFPGELEHYLRSPETIEFAPESLAAVADRMMAAVAGHLAAAAGHGIVFVSHQDPVQAARLALTGRGLEHLQIDKPGHAAVITLVGGAGEWVEASKWEPPQGPAFPPPG